MNTVTHVRVIVLVLCVAYVVQACGGSSGDDDPNTPEPAGATATEASEPNAGSGPPTEVVNQDLDDQALSKKPDFEGLDSHLANMVSQLDSRSAPSVASIAPHSQGSSVAVSIRVDDDMTAMVAYLRTHGADVRNIGDESVEAYVPVTELEALGEQKWVVAVEMVGAPAPHVTSEGLANIGSLEWNAEGYTGVGIKIGIIDGGFEGISAIMGTEVPANLNVRCYATIGAPTTNIDVCENGNNHGTAVAETIFDVAPQAEFYIANATGSQLDLHASVRWMIDQGVTVINQSLGGHFEGPGDGRAIFSDDTFAAIDAAVAAGIVWVNSAGNYGLSSWTSNYLNDDDDQWLDFASSDELNSVYLAKGQMIQAWLRWDDQWPAATRDLDFYLLDQNNQPVAAGRDPQSQAPGHLARERIYATAPSDGWYHFAIEQYSGSRPGWVQMQVWGLYTGEAYALENRNTGYSIAAPAESANPGMLTVGAVHWNSPNTIESYSSQGPTIDGRLKPEIVGNACATMVSTGRPFCGTSQASPYVAGLVALVQQRFSDLTPAEVVAYLESNAIPTGQETPNMVWGYGRANLPIEVANAP